jgi:hypothetical protein
MFCSFVDHVSAAAQAARTALVSCGVAWSGHGLRNLAAMMTRRSLMVIGTLRRECLGTHRAGSGLCPAPQV